MHNSVTTSLPLPREDYSILALGSEFLLAHFWFSNKFCLMNEKSTSSPLSSFAKTDFCDATATCSSGRQWLIDFGTVSCHYSNYLLIFTPIFCLEFEVLKLEPKTLEDAVSHAMHQEALAGSVSAR